MAHATGLARGALRVAGRGTPRGEVGLGPPRASLGHSAARARIWQCCGVDWGGRSGYDAHLAGSHGGDRRGSHAPGGSGQGVEPRRRNVAL